MTDYHVSGGSIDLNRPRVTYRVTVGRLSWESSDLAAVYGASCAEHWSSFNTTHSAFTGSDYSKDPVQAAYTAVYSGCFRMLL